VFTYLADFSNTEEWDPGVIAASRLSEGEIGLGSQFRLEARFMGRSNELTYRIVEYEPPRSVTLLGETDTVVSRDRITFEAVGSGTRITYDAELTLKGPLRLADPLLALAFKRVGDRALAGMTRILGGAPSLR
jgi:hypothetical protein